MSDYENYNQDDIFDEIELTMCDVVLQELIDNLEDVAVVDNNTTTVYSLDDNETITFPIHSK